ncbi:DUF1534 domain-containing protein [Pseudomonas tremae]|nr:DUF1534 domain-containing protein [Pseudomonas tremae]MCF5807615.1 DUF1534 domain-containing protein [Pseudomonas tremae]
MGLTVGRGRINKNELAGKYLERFVVVTAGHLSSPALQRGDALHEAPRHIYTPRRRFRIGRKASAR